MLYDIIGWVGMILVLLSYIFLSTDKIKNGLCYQILNLLAGVLMAVGLFPKKVWFSFSLQVVWSIVALISIIKIFVKDKSK